jgi:DNA-binding NtrC family response regulator
MEALRAAIGRLAAFDASVLVRGETGVGKELVARALHARSVRARGPFVPVNCGALPPDLVTAELFGSAPGAFTGARRRDGLVTQAHGGVLFLDEIGDLPLPAQVVLLRVLETGEVQPVGDGRPRTVDFRLVSATHRDLRAMVRHGAFRQDLYHRLAAFELVVPPLRERLVDLPALAAALVPGARLTPAAVRRLEAHPWPGNVRELRNVLLRAALLAGDQPIQAGHVEIDEAWVEPEAPAGDRPLRLLVAECVAGTWRRHAFNVRATARVLGVSPTTVYRHLAILGIAAREG